VDFNTQSQIYTDLSRIKEIFNSGIFSRPQDALFQSAFIEIIIRLRDLLFKAEKFSQRVNFDTDIIKIEDATTYGRRVIDVTDAIIFVRDAVCHVDSDNHKIDTNTFSFNVGFGKGNFISYGEKLVFKSDYEDEVSFMFGPQRLYLKRHIIRAYQEVRRNLSPLLPDNLKMAMDM
jgi:hypothetical protein